MAVAQKLDLLEPKGNPEWVKTLSKATEESYIESDMGRKRDGLYTILIRRLQQLDETCNKEIIPFYLVFGKLCRNFSISKKECWDILFLLRDVGIIEIVPFHGIKILKQEKN